MKQKLLFTFLGICLIGNLSGQSDYKHEIQIGPAIGIQGGLGLHTFYFYQINKYVRLKTGFVANHFFGYNMFSSRLQDYPVWAQMEWTEVRYNTPEHRRDYFDIGSPARAHNTSSSEFYLTPEIGIDFLSPAFINKKLNVSLGFSFRKHLVASYSVVHLENIEWFDQNGNYQGMYYIPVTRYDRYIERLGVCMPVAVRYNFSERSFAGLFMAFHGYSYKGDLITSFTDIFTAPYAAAGVSIGTKFGSNH